MQKASYSKLLEIACFNVASCLLAQEAGADRIEFCADYSAGGITPSKADIIKAKELLRIPIHVIIRPRGGNFVYNEEEINIMKQDILFCRSHNIDGVVFGVLTADNEIDKAVNKELVQLADGMSTTFHRAIDECNNYVKALEDLVSLGFIRVLTSGSAKTAFEGLNTLKKTQSMYGSEIIIIPGGGIRSENIAQIISETNCYEFHSAALTTNKNLVDENEVRLLNEKTTNA